MNGSYPIFDLLFFYHLVAGENNCTRSLGPEMNTGDGNKNREEGYESLYPITKKKQKNNKFDALLFFFARINTHTIHTPYLSPATISAIIRGDLDLGY